MDWRNWQLLESVFVLFIGLALTTSPFLIHEHTHPGHIGLEANQINCIPSDGINQEHVYFSNLSPPVREAIRKTIDQVGEEVILHPAHLINGDEGGDWEVDSEKEGKALSRLFSLAENDTWIVHNETCYVLIRHFDAGGGFLPLTPLLLVFGVPGLLYGAYKTMENIQER